MKQKVRLRLRWGCRGPGTAGGLACKRAISQVPASHPSPGLEPDTPRREEAPWLACPTRGGGDGGAGSSQRPSRAAPAFTQCLRGPRGPPGWARTRSTAPEARPPVRERDVPALKVGQRMLSLAGTGVQARAVVVTRSPGHPGTGPEANRQTDRQGWRCRAAARLPAAWGALLRGTWPPPTPSPGVCSQSAVSLSLPKLIAPHQVRGEVTSGPPEN